MSKFPAISISPSSFTLTSFILVSAVTLGGCAVVKTAPERGPATLNTETIMPVPKNRKGSQDSGVAFSYKFEGSTLPTDGTCRIRFVKKDSGKSFLLTLKSVETAAFLALDPGQYEAGRMGCGLTRVYEMSDLYPNGFRVEAGKASYLGKLLFKFTGKDLTEVNKASRSESALGFTEVSGIVPPGTSIISAFTLIPITQEMAGGVESTGGFSVRAKGVEGPTLTGLLSDLQGCEKQVAKADPLRFGTLDYTAAYDAGRFSDFKERRDTNAFPEELRTCISQTLSAFKPASKKSVEIRVTY